MTEKKLFKIVSSRFTMLNFVYELESHTTAPSYSSPMLEIEEHPNTYGFVGVDTNWGDGDGAQMKFVFEAFEVKDRVKKSLGFYRLNGTRSSYGEHWFTNSFTRVYPQKVEVTQYVEKPQKG